MAADALAAAGARVHLAHPLGVKAFEYRRVRNDERDAGDLADLLRMGRLPEAWIAPPPTRELRELVRHRAKLVATRSGCKVQVHAVLAKCGIQVAVSDLFGGQGSRVLDELVLPGVFPARVASYRRVIEALDFEIGVFEHLLGGRLRDDRGYQAVQTIPGIGPVLGAVFVAEIGQVSRFARPRAAGVLGGVDTQAPRVRHQGPPRTDHQAGLAAGALGHGGVRAAGGQRPPGGEVPTVTVSGSTEVTTSVSWPRPASRSVTSTTPCATGTSARWTPRR